MAMENARTDIDIAGIRGSGLMDRTGFKIDAMEDQASNAKKAGKAALFGGIAQGVLGLATGGLLG